MKKISLKTLKEGLTRDELRALKGGGCGNGPGQTCYPGSLVFDCRAPYKCISYPPWGPGAGMCVA